MAAQHAEPLLPYRSVLVTGADGFVGQHLVPVLKGQLANDASLALASRSRGLGSNWIALDLCDPASVAAAISTVQPDLVIHLAAQASVGQALNAAYHTWSVNLGGSLTLANTIKANVPRCAVLLASSVEVYGLTFNEERVTEVSPLRPRGAYACSKAAAEAMFSDVLGADNQLIVARPTNHSGPGQDERFVVPAFAAQIARIERGATPEISVGSLGEERDFLDVRDVVDAYIAILAASSKLSARSIFNVASGKTVKVGELLNLLRRMSHVGTTVVQDEKRTRFSAVPRTCIDNSLLCSTTGWTQKRDLESMLTDVLLEERAKP